ncbi:MAG TPA: hypothetical protein VKB46_19610, partial [Pyrinomonadaceae bacterium]|nr:hypothetical protein [Pyrinomonadaceae bacterium]
MSNSVAEVLSQAMQQQTNSAGSSQQTPTRSFQAVLQDGSVRPRTVEENGSKEKSETVSGASLEQLRTELTKRLNQIPNSAKSFDEIWPELLRTRTRMGLLRDAMQGVDNTPTGTNLKGLFGRVEGEWYGLEQIMRSDKDLSSGELLGLQARLYQVSQHIDVMSKVVDQMTSGIKT